MYSDDCKYKNLVSWQVKVKILQLFTFGHFISTQVITAQPPKGKTDLKVK